MLYKKELIDKWIETGKAGEIVGRIGLNGEYEYIDMNKLINIYVNSDENERPNLQNILNFYDGFSLEIFYYLIFIKMGSNANEYIIKTGNVNLNTIMNRIVNIRLGLINTSEILNKVDISRIESKIKYNSIDIYLLNYTINNTYNREINVHYMLKDIKLYTSMPVVVYHYRNNDTYYVYNDTLIDSEIAPKNVLNTLSYTEINMMKEESKNIFNKYISIGKHPNIVSDGIYGVILISGINIHWYISKTYGHLFVERHNNNTIIIKMDTIKFLLKEYLNIDIKDYVIGRTKLNVIINNFYYEPVGLEFLLRFYSQEYYTKFSTNMSWLIPNKGQSLGYYFNMNGTNISINSQCKISVGYNIKWGRMHIDSGNIYTEIKVAENVSLVNILITIKEFMRMVKYFMDNKDSIYESIRQKLIFYGMDERLALIRSKSLLKLFVQNKVNSSVFGTEYRSTRGAFSISSWNKFWKLNNSSGRLYIRLEDVKYLQRKGYKIHKDGDNYFTVVGNNKPNAINLTNVMDKMDSLTSELLSKVGGSEIQYQYDKTENWFLRIVIDIIKAIDPKIMVNLRVKLLELDKSVFALNMAQFDNDEITKYLSNEPNLDYGYIVHAVEELLNIDFLLIEGDSLYKPNVSKFDTRRVTRPFVIIAIFPTRCHVISHIDYINGTDHPYPLRNLQSSINYANLFTEVLSRKITSKFPILNIRRVRTRMDVSSNDERSNITIGIPISNIRYVLVLNAGVIEFEILAQFIDKHGKTTAIFINLNNALVCIHCFPISPMNIPEKNDIHTSNINIIINFFNQYNILPHSKMVENNMVIGIWYLLNFNMYYFSISPINDTYEELPITKCSDTIENIHDILVIDDSITKLIFNCIFWIFTLWYQDNKYDIMESTLIINNINKPSWRMDSRYYIEISKTFVLYFFQFVDYNPQYKIINNVDIGYKTNIKDAMIKINSFTNELITGDNTKFIIEKSKNKDMVFHIWHYLSHLFPDLKHISPNGDLTPKSKSEYITIYDTKQDAVIFHNVIHSMGLDFDIIYPEYAKYTEYFHIYIKEHGILNRYIAINTKDNRKHAVSIGALYKQIDKIERDVPNLNISLYSYIMYKADDINRINTSKVYNSGEDKQYHNDPIKIVQYKDMNSKKVYAALISSPDDKSI